MTPVGLDGAPRPPLRHSVHRFRRRTIDFDREVAVMAIVNRTPDSFFDRGRTFGLEAALAATARAEREKWTRLVRELGIKPEG